MSENHLAIVNMPIQQWGELYTQEEALNVGTIFHDLNMPFFAAESVMSTTSPIASGIESTGISKEQAEREQLMTKINQVSFFLDDLTLYLDTHEKDAQALQLYHEKSLECAELRKQFAQKFYPLTKLCVPFCGSGEASFCLQDGPMPWEGACV
ncbi:spore coat protein CotJB [Konateibacter massiliensis]|uniref:spore coat protein CotJB n=1 Tax=Konateibacter massiliensis TaxID=2002841 RepID=UPI000C1604FA|nr:spore coat protein CotJB [Konateibacter massiliensis]